eukprot:gnl/Dysnectes_brevis/4340_a5783_447.p1 GENE.gnl/Dysnectes_brevis/4340_a5783_447~~gnl/Dysnectes_brevis/4340_a5783_447.p1  ORF type:complete len:659 (+),score=81.44 gnl/Dysnectes_brevis/4340_a5783_447:30-1979(+)
MSARTTRIYKSNCVNENIRPLPEVLHYLESDDLSELEFRTMQQKDVQPLFKSLPSSGPISITITRCPIQGNGPHIASFLAEAGTLQHLSLDNCELTDSDAIAIISSLSSSSPLRHLNLSSNKLSADTAEGLAQLILQGECPLKTLTLAHNQIRDRGALALVDALSHRPSSLVSLGLEHCGLGFRSGRRFLEHCKSHNCRLVRVSLGYNSIGQKLLRQMDQCVRGRIHGVGDTGMTRQVPRSGRGRPDPHLTAAMDVASGDLQADLFAIDYTDIEAVNFFGDSHAATGSAKDTRSRQPRTEVPQTDDHSRSRTSRSVVTGSRSSSGHADRKSRLAALRRSRGARGAVGGYASRGVSSTTGGAKRKSMSSTHHVKEREATRPEPLSTHLHPQVTLPRSGDHASHLDTLTPRAATALPVPASPVVRQSPSQPSQASKAPSEVVLQVRRVVDTAISRHQSLSKTDLATVESGLGALLARARQIREEELARADRDTRHLVSARRIVEELHNKGVGLEQSLRKADMSVQSAVRRAKDARSLTSRRQEEAGTLTERVKGVQSDLVDAEKGADAAESELSSLKEALKSDQVKLEGLRRTVTRLNRKRRALEAEHREREDWRDDHIRYLSEQLARVSGMLEGSKARLSDVLLGVSDDQ